MGAKDSMSKIFDFVKEQAGEKLKELGGEVFDELKNEGKEIAKKKIEECLGNKDLYAEENTVPQNSSEENINTDGGRIEIDEEMTREEEDKFLEQMSSSLLRAGAGGLKNPLEALAMINTLVNTAGDVIKFTEVQETKRAEIESKRQQAIAKIEAEKRLLMLYLEKTFDERKEIFQQQFRVVDDALKNRDNKQLSVALESIVRLAGSSPFKDIVSIEKTSIALKDKNTVWDL